MGYRERFELEVDNSFFFKNVCFKNPFLMNRFARQIVYCAKNPLKISPLLSQMTLLLEQLSHCLAFYFLAN